MNFCSRFLRLSLFPWCEDRPQIAVMVGVIGKIKMARNWRISVVFSTSSFGVRESASFERFSSYGN